MPGKFHQDKIAEILAGRPNARANGMPETIREYLRSRIDAIEESGKSTDHWVDEHFLASSGQKKSLPRPDAHELITMGESHHLVCYEVVDSAAINCGRMAWYSSLCDHFHDLKVHLFVYDCRSDSSFLMHDYILENQQFHLEDASYHKGFQLARVVGDWCVTAMGLDLTLVNRYNLATYSKELEDA